MKSKHTLHTQDAPLTQKTNTNEVGITERQRNRKKREIEKNNNNNTTKSIWHIYQRAHVRVQTGSKREREGPQRRQSTVNIHIRLRCVCDFICLFACGTTKIHEISLHVSMCLYTSLPMLSCAICFGIYSLAFFFLPRTRVCVSIFVVSSVFLFVLFINFFIQF